MKTTTPETALIRVLMDYLHLHKIPCWRQNTTGTRRRDQAGREFWVPSPCRGVSDILGCLPPTGRLLAVEAKVKPNRPSDDQEAFLANVQAAGGLAIVAYTLDDLIGALDQ